MSYYRRKKRQHWLHGGGRARLGETAVGAVLDSAKQHTEYGYRQVAAALRWEHPEVRLSASSVYRILRQHGLLGRPTARTVPHKRVWIRFEREKPHELWQTDVSYWYIEGWGFYYLHTVLDDHSRFIIVSRLYRTYGADDGIRMLNQALAAVPAAARPGVQLLVDHGVTYTAADFQEACENAHVALIFAGVRRPQTKGKIERWHRTARESIQEAIRYAATPQEAQRILDTYVEHYNYERPHSACGGYPPISRYNPTEARKMLG